MYCETQDLIDRFSERELIQLTDFDSVDEIGQLVIDKAIADVDSKIDGFLRLRYNLPLLYVPQELIAAACDMTRYQLHREAAESAVTEHYKSAISYLKDLATGRAVLPAGVNDITIPVIHTALPKVSASPPIFSDQFLSRM